MPVSEILAQRIKAMPKVEIHVHLEGSITSETVWEMAKHNRMTLPAQSLEEWKNFYKFRDFNHFIDVYAATCKCIRTPEDYVLIVEQFIKHQADQNIRYSEVFISISRHLDKFHDEALLDALAEGISRGEKKYGSRIKFIADITRQFPETQTKVLELTLKGKERGFIIGIGIGGKEVGYPPHLFTDTFSEARRQGLRITAHAGETEGPQSIRGAITSLRAERIGHGVRCLEDPELVAELQKTQLPLDVSPISNYCLGIVKPNEPHPIRQMIDSGLYCTLNSDDPPMFSTNLINEYATLASQGFSWEELWRLNCDTLEATFLNKAEKTAFRSEWKNFQKQLNSSSS